MSGASVPSSTSPGSSIPSGSTPPSSSSTTPPPSTPVSTTVTPSSALTNFLDLINGTDAYDSTSLAVGKLSTSEHLFVPIGFDPTALSVTTLGKSTKKRIVSNDVFAQIYAMNKAAFGNDERAMRIALLRVLAVQAGWYTGTYEVTQKVPPTNAVSTLETDLDDVTRFLPDARLLAILLPLAAEHTFRTMGHHYLTGMAPEYSAKYQKFFNACVQPVLTSYLAPEDLYHKALHWVSLVDSLIVARSTDCHVWLPNAVIIRATSSPAGTAIIATSNAILSAMDGTGLKDSLVRESGVKVDLIESMTVNITNDPGAFHTIPTAYKRNALTGDMKSKFDTAKVEAIKIAPVLQGFLDALPNSSSLSQVRALTKHADANPLLRKRAKTFFREVGTTKATNMAELFASDKRSKIALEEEVVEEEE